ncbi:MAG: NTP transferase domain-containing protein [Methanomicrobiales archaeon]|nr:NTP transferase domain-containing protein [Methanomicrobiales archaeon]
MLALIMGGGEGSRLGLGEKPLVTVQGKPMIGSVIEAFNQAGHEVLVVLTPRTPYTANWCRTQGVPTLTTKGKGYVEDLVEAVRELEEKNPLFTSVSDLPCLRPATLRQIHALYQASIKPACSTWVPVEILQETGLSCHYPDSVDGVLACPAGVNIVMGSQIQKEQEEDRFVLSELDLALHVNTRSDLAIARALCPQIRSS